MEDVEGTLVFPAQLKIYLPETRVEGPAPVWLGEWDGGRVGRPSHTKKWNLQRFP